MKTNLFLFAAFTAAFLSGASFSAAQVTIGGGDAPKAGTILDLNSTTKGGLVLSNVELTSLTAIPASFPNASAISNPQLLAGMMVYNLNDFLAPNGVGIYIWDGNKWNYTGGSDGIDILTGGGSIPIGVGTFSGKPCFDIATGNSGINGCGTTATRKQTDFTIRTSQDGVSVAPYSGVQVYTFTFSGGTVSNVRFGFTEAVGAGKIVESIMPVTDYSGSGISTAKVTVNYKSSLQNDLSGLTRDKGLTLKLYAIYNDGNIDRAIELNISLQDCACCGAYVKYGAAPKVWKEFMCHNLGANEGADPFTPSAEIHGAKYKWGVSSAALTQAQDQDENLSMNSTTWGALPSTSIASGTNWLTANPCPPGWRVPTKEEWAAVINTSNNAITKVGTDWTNSADNYVTGMKVGDALVLPTAGRRLSDGMLNVRGSTGYYWSSTANRSAGCNVYFNGSAQSTGDGSNRSYGFSVRCISD
jgi:uncharacterized protein (TIGR02145 family)